MRIILRIVMITPNRFLIMFLQSIFPVSIIPVAKAPAVLLYNQHFANILF